LVASEGKHLFDFADILFEWSYEVKFLLMRLAVKVAESTP
jgi:hypothetical protein